MNSGIALLASVAVIAPGCSGGDSGIARQDSSLTVSGEVQFAPGEILRGDGSRTEENLAMSWLVAETGQICNSRPQTYSSPRIIHELPVSGEFELKVEPSTWMAGPCDAPSLEEIAASGQPFEKVQMHTTVTSTAERCTSFCENSEAPTCTNECTNAPELLATSRLDARSFAQMINSPAPQRIKATLQVSDIYPQLPVERQRLELLPDFQLDARRTASSILFEEQFFAEPSCAVAEKCVAAPGMRRLMRFDTSILNLGSADFELGDPVSAPRGTYEYSACHEHYHLKSIMDYQLSEAGLSSPAGQGNLLLAQKQSFCMRDDERLAGEAPSQYDCDDQGLTAGWADVYTRQLECQWIDVTDVEPGTYQFTMQVNPERRYSESDSTNNRIQIQVTLPEEF